MAKQLTNRGLRVMTSKSNLTKREEGLEKWNSMRAILNSFPFKRGYDLCTSLYRMGIEIAYIDPKNYTDLDTNSSDYVFELIWTFQA